MTGYLDEAIRSVLLILSKMSWYVKTFKDEGRDTNENTKLMSLLLDDYKNYKNIQLFGLRLNI